MSLESLGSDSSTWIAKSAPQVSGIDLAEASVAPSLALDSSGNPGIAWWARDLNSDYNVVLMYWKPAGGSAPVKVMDSQNNQSDELAVKLAYFGLNPRVLAFVIRSDADYGVGLHSTKSDDGGLSWSTPVVIPPDGDSSTDYPFDLAVDSQGRGAAFFGENGSSGNYQCGNPKLSRSDDFVHWTTCAAGPLDVTAGYSVYPAAMAAAFGGNDRLYLFWWDTAASSCTASRPPGPSPGPASRA